MMHGEVKEQDQDRFRECYVFLQSVHGFELK